MPTRSYDAIVLLTRDIGEADRLCILFTREAGRKAARARAARKTGSKLGGMLLPLRRVRIEVDEHGGMAFISSVVEADKARDASDPASFARAHQGVELLLRLTEDDEPLPAVFDLLLELQEACAAPLPDPVLSFHLRLLHLLGLLPATMEDPRVAALSPLSRTFLLSYVRGGPLKDLCALPGNRKELGRFRDALLAEQLSRPLHAAKVGEAMMSGKPQ